MGPVAQWGGERLSKDVLEIISMVCPHPFWVDRHPRRVGKQVRIGLGAPEGSRGNWVGRELPWEVGSGEKPEGAQQGLWGGGNLQDSSKK